MKYRVRVSTLTPLHIGTGEVLLRNYDYVSGSQHTYMLNQDAVFADAFERTGQVPNQAAGRLVATTDLREGSPFVRYSLSGTTTVDEIREQIKDVHGRCYLPGSSLKGALRTVLLAFAYSSGLLADTSVNFQQNRRGQYVKESAAANFEAVAFRPMHDDANYDLLRALQVADSEALPLTPSPLQLLHAQVFTGGKPSAPIWTEAIRPDTTFTTQLKVDDDLLAKYADQLGWGKRTNWFARLPELAHDFAQKHCAHERDVAVSKELAQAAAFYSTLLESKPGPNRFLLQMSWGAGWGAKTIGELLPEDTQWEMRSTFELGRPPNWKGRWEPSGNKEFPSSRRLAVRRGNNEDAVPGVPLGWVLVEMHTLE